MNVVSILSGFARASAKQSATMARWDAEQALLKSDPVLALLCRIEAIADHRAENDVCAANKLPAIADLARMAIAKHTGHPFENLIFP